MRAWSVAQGEGVWRFDWIDGKAPDGKSVSLRQRLGLIAGEALTRAGPMDHDTREAFVELLLSIEAGAVTGARTGIETEDERRSEDGEG